MYALATVVVDGDPMCNSHARAHGDALAAEPELPAEPTHGRRNNLTPSEIVKAIQACPAGMTTLEVARKIGVSKPTVRKYRRPEPKTHVEVVQPTELQIDPNAKTVDEAVPLVFETREIPIEEAKRMFPMVAEPLNNTSDKVQERTILLGSGFEPLVGYPWTLAPHTAVMLGQSYDMVIAHMRTTRDQLVAAADEATRVLESLEDRRAAL